MSPFGVIFFALDLPVSTAAFFLRNITTGSILSLSGNIFNKIILVTTLTNFPCIICTIIHTIYNRAKLNLDIKIIIPIFESLKE